MSQEAKPAVSPPVPFHSVPLAILHVLLFALALPARSACLCAAPAIESHVSDAMGSKRRLSTLCVTGDSEEGSALHGLGKVLGD